MKINDSKSKFSKSAINNSNNNFDIKSKKSFSPNLIKRTTQIIEHKSLSDNNVIQNTEPDLKYKNNEIVNLKTLLTNGSENINRVAKKETFPVTNKTFRKAESLKNDSLVNSSPKSPIRLSTVLNSNNITNKEDLSPSSNNDTNTLANVSAQVGSTKSSNIKVIVRFRPLNNVEKDFIENKVGFITCNFTDNNTVTLKLDSNSSSNQTPYRFDRVFDINTSQEQIYDIIGRDTIIDVCNGYNGTIFTYGQSGSDKTFTMYGNDIYDDLNKGIIPRAIDHLFKIVENSGENNVFQLKFSILQIYKEVVYDLLTGQKDLKIKESPTKGIYIEGLSEFYIDNTETFLDLLTMSQEQRIVSGTKLNQYSSRSHTIFMLEVNQTLQKQNITKRGILNLVDLAGTEKVSKTGAVGETLEEAKKINLSLSALGNVIHSLTSNSDHIPYRDSKLTRILQESLGGNYKTTLVTTCSPHSYHLEETISTLKFAQRAKTIKNKVKMNIKLSYEELQKIISNLRIELDVANKEIFCLKNILSNSGNIGENIVNIIESENVKSFIQSEILLSDRKVEIEGDRNESNGLEISPEIEKHNLNLITNNTSSNVNIILTDKKDIEHTLKKLDLMNRRSSFMDASMKNKIKNLLGGTNLKAKNTNESMSSNSSSGKEETNGDLPQQNFDTIHEIINIDASVTRLNRKLTKRDEIINRLEIKIKSLEDEISQKNKLLSENNRDIVSNCRELYNKINLEILNNKNTLFQVVPNLDIAILRENILATLNKYNCKFNLSGNKLINKSDELFNNILVNNFFDNFKNINNKDNHINLINCNEIDIIDSMIPMPLIQYCLKIDLMSCFMNSLANQNKIINNQNVIFVNLLEEMMNMNQLAISKLSEEEITIDNGKESFVIRGPCQKSNLKSQSVKINNISPALVNSGRAPKLLTKNNVKVIKTLNSRRKSSCENGLVSSLGYFQNNTNSLGYENMIFENNNESDSIRDNSSCAEDKSSLIDLSKTNYNNYFASNPPEMIKNYDKCMLQYKNLKEFILKSNKDAFKVKENFDKISKNIEFFIGNIEKAKEINFKRESNSNINSNDILNLIHNPPSPRINESNLIKNKINKKCLDEIDEKEEREETEIIQNNQFSFRSPVKGKSIALNKELASQSIFSNYSNNSTLLTDKSLKSVEKLLTKYTTAGCASKKFDGIKFKINNEKNISIDYESGLNCNNKISSPAHTKIGLLKGDFTISVLDEEEN